MTGTSGPPRLARALVRWLADGCERDSLLGELSESFDNRATRHGVSRARRWYWRQALILSRGLTGDRFRSAMAPGALVLDARRAGRSLRRSSALTIAGVATLGIGIAAPTAAFGIIEGMFAKLPVDRPEEVVAVRLLNRESGHDRATPFSVFREWRRSTAAFVALGAFDTDNRAVSGPGFAPARVQTAAMTPGVFSVLGVAPLVGRTLNEDDVRPGSSPIAVIREDLWEEWFDRDPAALGSEIRVGDTFHTLVGVMPADFGFPESHRLWTALVEPTEGESALDVVGRLSAGTSVESARTELTARLAGVAESSAMLDLERTAIGVEEYVLSFHGRRTRTLLWGLNLLVGLLVMIAAANLSALFLARGTTRSAETALRLSIGGSRTAVVRPLVFEALFVSAGGALIGLFVAQGVASWMASTLEARGVMPYWADVGFSPPVLLFVAALMLGATVLAGVLPALRTSRVHLAEVMKTGPTDASGGRIGLLPLLVGMEVALACVLLLLSAVVVRSALATVQRVGAFPMEGVLTAELILEEYDYPDVEARRTFWSELERELTTNPEVEVFTFATAMPGDSTSDAWIAVDGGSYERDEDWPRAQRRVVDPQFFGMFGMSTLAGRTFDPADSDDALPVAVVNEAFVREHLATSGRVIGQRLLIRERNADPIAHEIVGLVSDPGVSVDDGERVAAVFLPVAQRRPDRSMVALRLRNPAVSATALRAFRAAVDAIDPNLPLDRVMTLEALVRRENDGGRILGTLFGSLGLSALLLAVVGLHGVVAFTTARRTYQIGVMRALGAPESSVLVDTLRRGLQPVVIGLTVGLAASWLLTPLLGREMLEGSSGPHDPVTFVAVPVVLLLGALGAVFQPARRASKVDPVRALRTD